MTPEQFARSLCYDLDLNSIFEGKITESMTEQLSTFTLSALSLDHEHRVPIRLEIRIGHQILRDQFEWDMGEPANDPETFARALCADLALGPEYTTEVAQTIREQLNEHASELLSKGKVREQDHYLVPSKAIRQPHELSSWEPSLDDMTEEELQEIKKFEEREARIAARESRKTGARGGRGAIQAPSAGTATQMIELDGMAVMNNFGRGNQRFGFAQQQAAMRRQSGSSNPFGRGGFPPEYIQARDNLVILVQQKSQLQLATPPPPNKENAIIALDIQINAVNERMQAVVVAHQAGH